MRYLWAMSRRTRDRVEAIGAQHVGEAARQEQAIENRLVASGRAAALDKTLVLKLRYRWTGERLYPAVPQEREVLQNAMAAAGVRLTIEQEKQRLHASRAASSYTRQVSSAARCHVKRAARSSP